ncbi:MAG: caspase family protein [Bacteroidetes bacterium]|nr:caspase family protein [Bacteroidota bacterium]
MKTKLFITLLFLVYSSAAFSQSPLYMKGRDDFNKENYEAAYEKFNKIIEEYVYTYSVPKQSEIYYRRAYCLYKLNKDEELILSDLQKSMEIAFMMNSLELYCKVATQTSPGFIEDLTFTEIQEKNGYLSFLISIVYAKSANQYDHFKSFEYLEKAFQLGYKDKDKVLAHSNLFNKIDFKKYIYLINTYDIVEDKYSLLIKHYVEKQINNWQAKGKFEKTVDYRKRVNVESREKMIDYYTQHYIDSVGAVAYNLEFTKNEYDADNEVFKIIFSELNEIYLPVPIGEARAFDSNFKNLLYTNQKFTLYNNKFELIHLDIVNPINDKIYSYDSKDIPEFTSNQLVLNFDDVNIELSSTPVNRPNNESVTKIVVGKSDVDMNIPVSKTGRTNTYALIIGNEDYQSYQTNLSAEQNVEFAVNDAKMFQEYCNKTLGIPQENIIFETNIGVVRMKQVFNQISSVIKNLNGEAEVIIYYAGHGHPDEVTKEPYLIPVDVSSNSLELAINLKDVYNQLTEYPSKKVVIFLDACFTGGGRELGLLASRGVKIKPKENILTGNLVVFSASSGNQSALPYFDKGHGMFTYYLLKKLQETSGRVSLGSLDEYLHQNVSVKSSIINNREQNPHTNISKSISESWVSWEL